MPAALTYPGVYVEEIPSGVRTITGVATSITAFIGRAKRGPVNEAKTINSFGDYERIFGGLDLNSTMSYAVRDFYLNGGGRAVIVRLYHPDFEYGEKYKKYNDVKDAVTSIADAVKSAAGKEAALTGATKKAESYTADPEMSAAQTILTVIKDAAKPNLATKDDIYQAAKAALPLSPPVTIFSIGYYSDKAESDEKEILSVDDLLGKTFDQIEWQNTLTLKARYEGSWGAYLRGTIKKQQSQYNLTITDTNPGGDAETFFYISGEKKNEELNAKSKLVFWESSEQLSNLPQGEEPVTDKVSIWESVVKKAHEEVLKAKDNPPLPAEEPEEGSDAPSGDEAPSGNNTSKEKNGSSSVTTVADAEENLRVAKKNLAMAKAELQASDGKLLESSNVIGSETEKKGLYALEDIDLFNLLCIPPYKAKPEAPEHPVDVDGLTLSTAQAYCIKRRAMLLVDPPSTWIDKETARKAIKDVERSRNAALFFPRLKQPNPLRDNQVEEFVPCGAIAGIMARTDTERGVWKAPAGIDATLRGVPELSVSLTDDENGELNPLGVNCLRSFPNVGRVIWGARTLRGADILADEYKYIPIRRLALFIEESLFRGTQWVVFEPNDEPLWAQIRMNVGAFMHNLFRQGAFQGTTPKQAYFVKCDAETNPQNDIDRGIVNIAVGFAPLKPAEFVIIKLQQIAGDIEF